MNVIEVTSFDTPEIRLFHGLTDAQLRSRQRPEEAAVIAEGPKVVLTAVKLILWASGLSEPPDGEEPEIELGFSPEAGDED